MTLVGSRFRLVLTTLALVAGGAAATQGPPSGAPKPEPVPPQVLVRPPEPPRETTPVDPLGAVPEGLVLDPETEGGPPPAKPRTPPKPKEKKKVATPPPAPPRVPPAPVSADHDNRAELRYWSNTASRPLPLPSTYASAVPVPVLEWALSLPGVVPRGDGTYSFSQQVILDSISRKPVEIQGFLRGYRRTAMPANLCATLWVGASQTSPLSACVLVRVPAVRLPPRVNEFVLTLAAAKGWPIRVKGFPNYRLNTKYATGVDRLVPWELDPAEFCEIQQTPDGMVPPAGAQAAWWQITQHLAPAPPTQQPSPTPALAPATIAPAPATLVAPVVAPIPTERASVLVPQDQPALHAPWEELERLGLSVVDKDHFYSMLFLLPNDGTTPTEGERILGAARQLAKGARVPVGYATLFATPSTNPSPGSVP